MVRKIVFTQAADAQMTALEKTPSRSALLKQVRKALGYLEIDPHHPGLQTPVVVYGDVHLPAVFFQQQREFRS